MNCKETQQHLGPYVDGELEPDFARAVDEHLRTCPSCRAQRDRCEVLADKIQSLPDVKPPDALWQRIDERLTQPASWLSRTGRRWRFNQTRVAAAIVLIAGIATAYSLRPFSFDQPARASSVDFGLLLDHVGHDPANALRKFLMMYEGVEIHPEDAKRRAPELSFELPIRLSGGFRLVEVYSLRFGGSPGILARYERGDECLITIFHRPVQTEDFGTHRDYPCIIGEHRGHQVSVGEWKLVHVTDPTTCHCVLSRLDETTELPPVLSAIAPSLTSSEDTGHRHRH